MGGTHSKECNSTAKDIWQWCIEKQIWLTAAHIPVTKNAEADRESRVFSDIKEWMIRPDVFQQITVIGGALHRSLCVQAKSSGFMLCIPET